MAKAYLRIRSYDVCKPSESIPGVDYSNSVYDASDPSVNIKATNTAGQPDQWEFAPPKSKMVLLVPSVTTQGCQVLTPLYSQGVSTYVQPGPATCVDIPYGAKQFNSLFVEVVRIGSHDEDGDGDDETTRPCAGVNAAVSSAQPGCGSSIEMQHLTDACGVACFENLTVGSVYKVTVHSTLDGFAFDDGSDTKFHRLCGDTSKLTFQLKRLQNTVRLMVLNRHLTPYGGAVIQLCDGRNQFTETADDSGMAVFTGVRAPGRCSIEGVAADRRKLRLATPYVQVRCGDQAQQVFADFVSDPVELRATMMMSSGKPAVGNVQLVSLRRGSAPATIAEAAIQENGCVKFLLPAGDSVGSHALSYMGKLFPLAGQPTGTAAAGADNQPHPEG
jgi:hypothetical protein